MSIYKICLKCQRSLKAIKKNFHKDSKKKDGLNIYCKKCRREMANKSRKKSYKENPLKTHEDNIKRLYGITYNDYLEMEKKQNHRCGICGLLLEETPINNRWKSPNKHFHIDHDHKTGKIRGLLCISCNQGLGKFRHDPEILKKAINYLEKNE